VIQSVSHFICSIKAVNNEYRQLCHRAGQTGLRNLAHTAVQMLHMLKHEQYIRL